VVSVVFIFVVSGLAMHGVEVTRKGFLSAVAVVLVVNLVIAPLIAAGVVQLGVLGLGLTLGFAVMASVPTTLSSAAVTAGVAGGDRAWAVGLTVVCVCVGAVTAPLTVALLLRSQAAIPPGPLLLKVLLIVVVPLAVGYVVARTGVMRATFWTKVAPSVAVIIVLWVTVSQSNESLVGAGLVTLATVGLLVAAAHLMLLGCGWIGGSWATRNFNSSRPQMLSIQFVAAQKTLPLALSVIVAIGSLSPQLAAVAGEAVLVCVLWHLIQLLIDSLFAARLARAVIGTSAGLG